MSKIIVERKGRIAALLRVEYFRLGVVVTVGCILASFALILWRLFPEIYGKNFIPLHYNIHYGVDWTGAWWQIFVYPVAAVIMSLANVGIALGIIQREPMLARVVLVGTVLLSAFLFCSTIFVVLMNIVYG